MNSQVLQFIKKQAGDERARAFAAKYGGGNLSIPCKVDAGHEIVGVIGLEAAQALCREWGGLSLYVGLEKKEIEERIAAVVRMSREGLSVAVIARKLGVSVRNVFRIRARYG